MLKNISIFGDNGEYMDGFVRFPSEVGLGGVGLT